MRKIEFCSWAAGVFLTFSGIFNLAIFPGIFSGKLKENLTIMKGTPAYDAWKNVSIPTKLSLYLFSVENPSAVVKGSKPKLKQMGPYTYTETLERISTVFHRNGTVTYEQRKFWYFLPEESSDLDEKLTVIDVPMVGAASSANSWISSMAIQMAFGSRPLFVSKTAREMLFDGYSDTLLTVGSMFVKSDIPMDKFGWFYKRNGTTWSDDFIEMDTGENKFSDLGDIRTWKYKNRTHYPGECGVVKGSAAGHLAPSKKDHFDYFSPDICRSIRFEKPQGCKGSNLKTSEDCTREYSGIEGVFYELNPKFTFGNVSTNPDNWCYHPHIPYGVHNGTGCKGDLPTFISLPHFYGADPWFNSLLAPGSLSPNKSKHSTSVTIHESTAVPLQISMRLQISLQLKRNEYIGVFSNLPTVFLPVMWFDAQVMLTPEMGKQLKMLDDIPLYVFWTGLILMICGLSLLLVMGWVKMTSSCRKKNHKQNNGVPIDLSDFETVPNFYIK